MERAHDRGCPHSHKALMCTLALSLSLLGLLIGCVPAPDFDGRSRQIQMLAFGSEIVRSNQLKNAYVSPDQGTWAWMYRLSGQQPDDFASMCIRPAEATSPERPFRSGPRVTVPGCVLWEGANEGSSVVILASATTLEIQENPNPAD